MGSSDRFQRPIDLLATGIQPILTTHQEHPDGVEQSARRSPLSSAARRVGFAAIILAFSIPAFLALSRRVAAVDLVAAVAVLPFGAFLIWRLRPAWGIRIAFGYLLLPVGTLWTIAGIVTLAGLVRADADWRLLLVGSALVAAAVMALATHRRDRDPSPDGVRPLDLVVLHLVSRIMGVAFIGLAIAAPILARAYPMGGIEPAPISLGLLPSGVFLATRPFPRRALGVAIATVVVPLGAIWFMFGALAVEGRKLEPEFAVMAVGAVLLAVAGTAAWSSWGSSTKGLAQIAVRAAAIVTWVMVGTISTQALIEPQDIYVEPVSMDLNGSTLIVEFMHLGPCGTGFLDLQTELVDQVLQVNITRSWEEAESYCLGSCLAGEQVGCTNIGRFTVEPAPPPGTKPVAAGRPLTGLLRAPFRWLLFGALLGAAIWKAGDSPALQSGPESRERATERERCHQQ